MRKLAPPRTHFRPWPTTAALATRNSPSDQGSVRLAAIPGPAVAADRRPRRPHSTSRRQRRRSIPLGAAGQLFEPLSSVTSPCGGTPMASTPHDRRRTGPKQLPTASAEWQQHLNRSITHAGDYPANLDFRRQGVGSTFEGGGHEDRHQRQRPSEINQSRGRRALAPNGTSPCGHANESTPRSMSPPRAIGLTSGGPTSAAIGSMSLAATAGSVVSAGLGGRAWRDHRARPGSERPAHASGSDRRR